MNFLLPLVFLTILSSVMGQVKVGEDAFYGFSGQVMVRHQQVCKRSCLRRCTA